MSLPTKEEGQTYLNETNTEALLQDALNNANVASRGPHARAEVLRAAATHRL